MHNRDLQAIWEWITKAYGQIVEWLKWCLEKLEAENVTCDGLLLFLILFLITFLLGSAFWSVSIAKCRRHKATRHFFLGLILPWGYPLYQLLHLQIKLPEKDDRDAEKAKEEASTIIDAIKTEEKAEAERQEEESRSEFNQQFFEKIARRSDGTPAGPWEVVFKGNIFHITKILEPLPDVVSVEFEADNSIRKMRMRYELIQSLIDLNPEQPAPTEQPAAPAADSTEPSAAPTP